IAVVEADERSRGSLRRQPHDLGAHLVEGRQIDLPPALDIDAVDAPVLVSGLILQEQHVPAVICPQMLADATLAIVGDRLGLRQIALGCQPHVQHSVLGGEEGDVFAIGAQAGLRLDGVAEQGGARDQGGGGRGCLGFHWSRHRKRRGEQQRRGPQYNSTSLRSFSHAVSSGTVSASRSPGVAAGSSTQRRSRSLPLMTSMASRSCSYSYGKSRQMA